MDVALGLLRMHRALLVVSRDAPTRVLGMVTRERVAEWMASHDEARQREATIREAVAADPPREP